ncbi:hypothetical protein C0993_009595, partial [Termitomyces sp. T159_Od127]
TPPPSPLDHQPVEAYIQQRDKVLCSLHISPAEFAKHACTLLVNLGHNNLFGTPEQWANRLLKFHELYQCKVIPESAQNTLQMDPNLWDELCALVDEIHTSPTSWRFEDPVDPMCSFYVQCEELIKPWDPVSASLPCQQEELNVASNILKALNLTRGLFNQPVAHTIGFSACSHVSLSSTFRTWGQPADTNSCPDTPSHPLSANNNHASTHTLSYINKLEASSSRLAPPGGAPAPEFQCDCFPHFNLRHLCSNALTPCNNSPPLCQSMAPGAP